MASRFENGESITCEANNQVLDHYREEPQRASVNLAVLCEFYFFSNFSCRFLNPNYFFSGNNLFVLCHHLGLHIQPFNLQPKCRKVVLEKWFFKLGFFFLVNHFSRTRILEPEFSNQMSRTTFLHFSRNEVAE